MIKKYGYMREISEFLFKNHNMPFFKKKFWFIVVLGLSAVLLRFYKLSDIFYFNIDEDWYSYIVRRIIVERRPVLIGWEIPGGINTTPVMYYIGALVMLFFNNNPLGYAVTASVIGVIGVLLVYFVGKKIFNSEKIAVYSSTIYCFSFFVNIYNRLSITLHLSPLVSLLTYYSLSKIIEQKKYIWLSGLAVVLILATQEGSTISLIALTVVSFFVFKIKFKSRKFILPLIIFFGSFAPLVLFDLRHNFQLTSKMVQTFSVKTTKEQINTSSNISVLILMLRTYSRMLIPTGPSDLNKQILPCNNYLEEINKNTPVIFSILGLLLIFIFFYLTSRLKKEHFGSKIIKMHLLIICIGLFLYSYLNPNHLYEWFFVVLTPAFSFILAYLLSNIENTIFGKITARFLILFIVAINLAKFLQISSSVGYKDKFSAVNWTIHQVKDKPFELDMIGNGCNGYGYRYLFTYLGKEPVKSYMDSQYNGWLYKLPDNVVQSSYKAVLVPTTDLDTDFQKNEYQRYKKLSFRSERFNNLEVLLIKEK